MDARAAVMTGPGAGAIATVQLCGPSAAGVLGKVFISTKGSVPESATGAILLGSIVDGDHRIDQVTIGCEGPETFAIHCHGNPLIVEQIVTLLARQGVELVSAEQMLATTLAAEQPGDAIALEAKLALTTVKTIEGARLISHQIEGGLPEVLRRWRDQIETMSLDDIAPQARQILDNSDKARLLIDGCTIALIGPPNTGKSTLLNTLAGRDKAIVTDVRGTTRDWVQAEIHLPPLAVTLIDTAGLDADLAESTGLDAAAQDKTAAILDRADLILLVLDASQPADQLNDAMIRKLVGKRSLAVLNKSDLPRGFDAAALPPHLSHSIRISAKQNQGIDTLTAAIVQTLAVTDMDPRIPIAFTDRHRACLERLIVSSTIIDVATIIDQMQRGSTGA